MLLAQLLPRARRAMSTLTHAAVLQRLAAAGQQAERGGPAALPDLAEFLIALAADIKAASAGSTAGAHVASTSAAAAAIASAQPPATTSPSLLTSIDELMPRKTKKARQAPREFDFFKYRQRYVALQIMYIGWNYHGFARQDTTEETIEGKMFAALRKVRLIPEDAEIGSLKYSRCGRTDKGVSALGQVVALNLRSGGLASQPELPLDQELDYAGTLNRALPPDIRVLGWAPVPEGFSARFSAQYREYKYFIVDDGTLDIQAIRAAAAQLEGAHDFRNFCKQDIPNVTNFQRKILYFRIEEEGTGCDGRRVYALRVRGTAFLWHQVRCMAAVLMMVGRGQEQPDIVSQLLDVSTVRCKPQYNMAAEEPLLLYECGFADLSFRRTPKLCAANAAVMASMVDYHLIGTALRATILTRIEGDGASATGSGSAAIASSSGIVQGADGGGSGTVANGASGAIAGGSGAPGTGAPHIPLLRRATEPSVEERMAKYGISIIDGGGGGAAEMQE